MATKRMTVCDVCEEVKPDQTKEGQRWGRVVMSFPNAQESQNIDDCCPQCASRIRLAIDNELTKIKTAMKDLNTQKPDRLALALEIK